MSVVRLLLHISKLLPVSCLYCLVVEPYTIFILFILDAAQGGAAAARGGAKEGAVDALTRKTGMSMEEACQILNITKDADLEKLTKVR